MTEEIEFDDHLVLTRNRPRQRLFWWFVRWYQVIISSGIVLIIGLSAYTTAPFWSIAAISAYLIYVAVRLRVIHRAIYLHNLKFQIARSLVLNLFVTIFLAYLYGETSYLSDNSAVDTLWLLYILAVLIMSQFGSTGLTIIMGVFAVISIASLHILYFPLPMHLKLVDIATKSLWLGLIVFILHILTRLINTRSSSLKLLAETQQEVLAFYSLNNEEYPLEISPYEREKHLFQKIAQNIATQFEYPHVNFFTVTHDNNIACVAGNIGGGGEKLVAEGFLIDSNRSSIIGRVVQTNELHVANNVKNCKYYYPHPGFPNTKSELVLPIARGTRVELLLDIQDDYQYAFSKQDVGIMVALTQYLGTVIETMRTLYAVQSITDSVTKSLLVPHSGHQVLDHIAEIATHQLNADLVVLYEYDRFSDATRLGAKYGKSNYPEYFRESTTRTLDIVSRILQKPEKYYFHSNLTAEFDNPLFNQVRPYPECTYPSFVEREEIMSRAIICLEAGTTRVGVMFVNFRIRREFNRIEQQAFFIFSGLAALVINRSQVEEQRHRAEQQKSQWLLHDDILNKVVALSFRVRAMRADPSVSAGLDYKLQQALENIQELRRDVRFLYVTGQSVESADFVTVIRKLVADAKDIYDVSVKLQWEVDTPLPLNPIIIGHLRAIINEAFLNAIKHGGATWIDLTVRYSNQEIEVCIEDNGHGFNENNVKKSGLSNMQERALLLGGICSVSSALNGGTVISVCIPISG